MTWRTVAVIFLLGLGIGCASQDLRGGVKLSTLRAVDPSRQTIEISIPRAKLRTALADRESLTRTRIVEIYFRDQEYAAAPHQYRLFDIVPGGVFDLLQLRHADVLVAANDYVIPSPQSFRSYLLLLEREREASIEIRRGGQGILLHYQFTD